MIKIKDIAIYVPKNKINNDKYLKENEGYKEPLENVFGKKERYVKDEDENTLTFMKKVAKKVLEKSGLTGQDIDMVVCCTQTPEFLIPPMSAVVHNYLNVKQESSYYDINVACIGMVFAFDQVYSMMLNKKNLNKVLIVGCDLVEQYTYKDSPGYGNFGDVSCAIILEKDNIENGSKLIETKHFADTTEKHTLLFPQCKISNIANKKDIDNPFKLISQSNGAMNTNFPIVKSKLTEILEDNNIKASEISMMCCSQSTIVGIETLRKHLGIEKDKCLFVGENFGYNACASPFTVLHEAIEQGKVKRGDYILFWTVGAGSQHIISLIKY